MSIYLLKIHLQGIYKKEKKRLQNQEAIEFVIPTSITLIAPRSGSCAV